MSETILRQLKLLEILPREPYKLSPEKIWSLIEDHGFNSSLRTIQRDLRDLSAILPIVCDDRSKPYGWSWHRNSSGLNPAMDPIEALTFSLAESYLKPLMPNKNFNRLKIFFDRANNVLENMDKSSIKRWRQNVRVVPQWQTLIPPEIDEEVESVIYDALLNANKLRVLYLRRGDTKPSCRIINPLGIVLQGVVLRLICTMDDTPEDLRHLPIHRFKSATIFNTKISKPKKFDLDKFIEDQNIGYLLSNKPLQLEAKFNQLSGFHLTETPISKSQTLKQLTDGSFLLKAKIPNTAQLRWWLLGFGGGVEVIKPLSLRKEFKEISENLVNIYK